VTWFPEIVLFMSVTVPPKSTMPPPEVLALFPETVLFMRVRSPPVEMPPPLGAALPETRAADKGEILPVADATAARSALPASDGQPSESYGGCSGALGNVEDAELRVRTLALNDDPSLRPADREVLRNCQLAAGTVERDGTRELPGEADLRRIGVLIRPRNSFAEGAFHSITGTITRVCQAVDDQVASVVERRIAGRRCHRRLLAAARG
jgi:hypothetical protein